MTKPVILTGLRANNDLHLGNYFGALLPLIDMAKSHADEYEINLFVPDLHSFTTPIDHSQLQAQITHNLRIFVAAGLPLNNTGLHIYRQSYVPAHSELTWILDCFTGFGEMGRMTQFKDKSKNISEDSPEAEDQISKADERISIGLLNYPVLMAADILLYGATYVPVGDDQSQHLEFTRDIAQRMNGKFGELFVIPKSVKEQHEFFGKDHGLRIKDLGNPAKKMSKSEDSVKGIIFLGDEPQEAAQKVMSATTDSLGNINYNPEKQPGISNLLQLSALLTHDTLDSVVKDWTGKSQYGELKAHVAEQVHSFLEEFQNSLENVDMAVIEEKLIHDETEMNQRANQTLLKVQKAVGLRS
jgi:tryptophanyl-tRNA synthetase